MNRRYNCADDITAIGVEQLIEKIGAQLGAIEEVTKLGDKYQGLVIVKVISCDNHPDADRLHVCKVDDGATVKDVNRDESGYVQVVCGAPNVHAGMLAVWLPPGSTVPTSYGDNEPFVLAARDIRGQVSNGMMASPKELSLGDNHEGIMEIYGDFKPGTDFAEAFELKDDILLDIENKMFTHRPDCFGFLGVARELAGIQDMPFRSPAWYVLTPEFPAVESEVLALDVRNELPELVPRFTAIAMRDIKVGPSPVWLQIELAKVGLRSINNIVDYTNFFMLETAQPLHAYDYDKIKGLSNGSGATIVVRNPKPGEKLVLLNGKTVEPRSEAIMIATDKQLIGVGGVMGGGNTEVDENTRNIILECANFDMYSIRRTAMAHGLFTDAVTRFTKGQSPLQNQAVLARIVDEIRKFAGGKVASRLIDDNHLDPLVLERRSLHVAVNVSVDFINSRLGLQLSAEEMKKLLENVEFKVDISTTSSQRKLGPSQKGTAEGDTSTDWATEQVGNDDAELTVTAPFWRTDIELREDIVEEVGRLYGFDKLPLKLPKRDLTPATKDPMLELKANIRQVLSKAGANEVLTYSFVHGNLLDKVGQKRDAAYQISNALSPDLQYYRLSLTPSLLEKVHPNIKAGYDQFALFEIGKAHQVESRDTSHESRDDGLPKEFERVALVFAVDKRASKNYTGAPYYQARLYLMNLLDTFGLAEQATFEPWDVAQTDAATPYYETDRAVTIKINGVVLGRIGEYKASVRQTLKLPDFCAGFELGLVPLMDQIAVAGQYKPLPRFPKVEQDICLKVASGLSYRELFDFTQAELTQLRPQDSVFSLTPVDIYQRQDNTEHKQITFRLSIANYDRTMTDSEVNTLLDKVAETAKAKFGAERI